MVAPSASSEVMSLEMEKMDGDIHIPRAFRWVMESSSSWSSSLTIGEHNKSINLCRAAVWQALVFLPSMFIAVAATASYIIYNKPAMWAGGVDGFPSFLPVLMLWGIYMAVVVIAMFHSTLFLPEAPYAALEALRNVGFEKIGMFGVTLTSVPALFFDLTCMLWSCLVALLIAAVLAFWIWLARTYGKKDSASIRRGLATTLALCTILTAALLAFMIHLVRYSDAQAKARDLQ